MRKLLIAFAIILVLVSCQEGIVPDCRNLEAFAKSTCYSQGTYIFTDDGKIWRAVAKNKYSNCCKDPLDPANQGVFWEDTGFTCGCSCAGIPIFDENADCDTPPGRYVFNGIIYKTDK